MKRLKALYRKLVPLRDQDTTPQVVLLRTLDKQASIKAVMILIQWHDTTWSIDWSSLKASEMTLAAYVLDENIRRQLMRDEI